MSMVFTKVSICMNAFRFLKIHKDLFKEYSRRISNGPLDTFNIITYNYCYLLVSFRMNVNLIT